MAMRRIVNDVTGHQASETKELEVDPLEANLPRLGC
jgi:hypothetical protein